VFRNFIVDSGTDLTHLTGQTDFSNDGNDDDDPDNDLGCISCILRLCRTRNFTILCRSWVWRHRLLPLCSVLKDMGLSDDDSFVCRGAPLILIPNYSTDLWFPSEPDFSQPRRVWHTLSRSYFHTLCAKHMEGLNTACLYLNIHIRFIS
jgi:hypothetical protein